MDSQLQQLAKTDRNPVQETQYQELLKQGGGGSSIDGIDMSQVPSVQDYIKGQFASEDPALTDLISTMQNREKPLDIYGRLETEAGLPELRGVSSSLSKEIASIEDYLTQIEPDVSARTRESMVTEAQRRGMVAAGREPYLEKLGTVGTALGRVSNRITAAEQGIGTKVGLAMQGQQMDLEPAQLRYATMVDRNARMTTGFTADRQTQLDVMFDKLARDRTLSDQDWQLANQLASEEKTYMRTLQTNAASAGITLTGQEMSDDILALIGKSAAEQIGYDRSQDAKRGAGAGISTAQKQVITKRAADDAKNWTELKDLQNKYAGQLSESEIVKIYTANTNWGAPKERWAQEILGILPTGSSVSDDLR